MVLTTIVQRFWNSIAKDLFSQLEVLSVSWQCSSALTSGFRAHSCTEKTDVEKTDVDWSHDISCGTELLRKAGQRTGNQKLSIGRIGLIVLSTSR